jgi:hypothetical protein
MPDVSVVEIIFQITYNCLQKKTYPPLWLKQYTPSHTNLYTQPGVTYAQIANKIPTFPQM